jgi:dTDP-glucose 4,6-dehydratase
MEIARAVLDGTGQPHSLIEFVADRPGHDYRYALDTTKIAALDWAPRVSLRDGMRQTIEWYRANEAWWAPLKSDDFWTYYRRNYRPAAG